MANMFQLGGTKSPTRPQRAKQEKTLVLVEEEWTRSKRLTDKAMMNTVYDDTTTKTTATALREAPPPGPIMGRTTIHRITSNATDQTNMDHIKMKGGNIQSMENRVSEGLLLQEAWLDR